MTISSYKTLVSIIRRVTLRVVPPIGATVLRVDQVAIRRPLLFAFLDIEGPKPSVWEGPIFIHIPKAAGSSVLKCGVEFTRGHKPYSFYAHHKPDGIEMPFTFAIVRHPLSRYISAFYYLKKGGSNAHDSLWAERNIPSGADHNTFAHLMQSDPKLLQQLHFRPQTKMVVDRNGSVGPNRILKFENINTEWAFLAEEHGLRRDLPHTNENTVEQDDRPKSTEKCRAIIRSLYKEDFETFDYKIDS